MSEAKSSGAGTADFRRIDAGVARERPFPVKAPSELRVHIQPEAARRMKDHAATTTEVELCGVLVGEVCQIGRASCRERV